MNAIVLTHGDPDAVTGGSLYHRRIAERARRMGIVVEIRPLRPGDDPRTLARDADVVVVDSIVAARVRARPLGRPTVASVHQIPGGLVGRLPARLARAAFDLRCYFAVDAVVVPSPFLASTLARGGVRASRIHIVPPGSDVGSPAETSSCGPSSAPRAARVAFACVANLSAHKRPLDLLDAFATLSDLDVSLTLAGSAVDAGLRTRVVERLSRPDVEGRARWIGPVAPSRVADLLAGVDVFVLPAVHEGYGMAVAEAMRSGIPAVVARSGNLPNLVRDGVEGFAVPPRDVGALAAAMRRAAADVALRRRMASAARRRGGSFPTWDRTAEAFFAVLRDVHPASAARRPGRSSAA